MSTHYPTLSHLTFLFADDVGDGVLAQRVAVGQPSASDRNDEFESELLKMDSVVGNYSNDSWIWEDTIRTTEPWHLLKTESKAQCRGYSWPVLFLFAIVILAIGRWR